MVALAMADDDGSGGGQRKTNIRAVLQLFQRRSRMLFEVEPRFIPANRVGPYPAGVVRYCVRIPVGGWMYVQ